MSNQDKVGRFASRYRMQLITVAALVGFFVIYGYVRRPKPFPEWEDKRAEKPIINSLPSALALSSGPAAESEDSSKRALYDPNDPAVDSKYRLPAHLSSDELHRLILDTDCLVDLADAHDHMLGDYNRLFGLMANDQVREVFYWHVKNRKGFKRAELPARWQQFTEAGPFSQIDDLATAMVLSRVERMHDRAIGGQYTAGDVKFVAFMTEHYTSDIAKLMEWIAKAKQLRLWLVEDSVLTPESDVETSVDHVKDAPTLIAEIRRRHSDTAGASAAAPIANLPTKRHEPLADPDSPVAAVRRQVLAKLSTQERTNLLSSLDHIALALTKDLRFAIPDQQKAPSRQKAPSNDLWGYMDEDAARRQREQYVPLLERAKQEFLAAREKSGVAYEPSTTVEPALRQANMLHDEQTEYNAEQLIQRVHKLGANLQGLTVGDVEDVKAVAAWIDEWIAKYAAQTKQLVESRQNSSR